MDDRWARLGSVPDAATNGVDESPLDAPDRGVLRVAR